MGHSKPAFAQCVRDILAGLAYQRQFKIVDGCGTVASNESNKPAVYKLDKQRPKTVFYQMGTGKKDNRFAGLSGRNNGLGHGLDVTACVLRHLDSKVANVRRPEQVLECYLVGART